MTIEERLVFLENKIIELNGLLTQSTSDSEAKAVKPYVSLGSSKTQANKSVDTSSGLGEKIGGQIIWNSSETNAPTNVEPTNPESVPSAKGYNKHTHSRFSGGALIKGEVEIVEYDLTKEGNTNPHSQGFWKVKPTIKTTTNSKNEEVPNIGELDLYFNPDTKKWGSSSQIIDIKNCYFVMRDDDGVILQDSKGQNMMAPLYQEDSEKTSIIWDENGNCWRLLAVYAAGV